jgi:hypothetical protein
MLRGVLRKVGFGSGRGRRKLHEGHDLLAAFRSFDRPSNDCGTHHRGMRIQHRLDLGRVDVLSKPNDQVFGSANDKKISVFDGGKIAGVEPSFWIARRRRTYLPRLPIFAEEQVGR